MDVETSEAALARIDAALARIEQGVATARARAVEDAARDARLRSAVIAALTDLDSLIGQGTVRPGA